MGVIQKFIRTFTLLYFCNLLQLQPVPCSLISRYKNKHEYKMNPFGVYDVPQAEFDDEDQYTLKETHKAHMELSTRYPSSRFAVVINRPTSVYEYIPLRRIIPIGRVEQYSVLEEWPTAPVTLQVTAPSLRIHVTRKPKMTWGTLFPPTRSTGGSGERSQTDVKRLLANYSNTRYYNGKKYLIKDMGSGKAIDDSYNIKMAVEHGTWTTNIDGLRYRYSRDKDWIIIVNSRMLPTPPMWVTTAVTTSVKPLWSSFLTTSPYPTQTLWAKKSSQRIDMTPVTLPVLGNKGIKWLLQSGRRIDDTNSRNSTTKQQVSIESAGFTESTESTETTEFTDYTRGVENSTREFWLSQSWRRNDPIPKEQKVSVESTGSTEVENATRECFVCGLDESNIPSNECHQLFAMSHHMYRWKRNRYKKHCEEIVEANNVTYIKKGGCFKRYLDLGGPYHERGCRTWPPYPGSSFASTRFVRLEMILRGVEEGCVFSPHASLTPFSRGISLYARYHVCVCKKRYCNSATRLTSYLVLIVLLVFISYGQHVS